MIIKVDRVYHGRNYIIGHLYINGTKFCDTLEPPLTRREHPGILPGRYRLVSYPSAKFKAIRPLVEGVHGRSGILIHEGNCVADTQGCILVGVNSKVGQVLSSKATLKVLLSRLKEAWKREEIVWLEVV